MSTDPESMLTDLDMDGNPAAVRFTESVTGSEAAGVSEDLPFLVTHWLAHYSADRVQGNQESKVEADDPERKRALERIRSATAELASAFTSLGAYGTTIPVSYQVSSIIWLWVPLNF